MMEQRYGKEGRFITEDEFRDAATDIAAKVAIGVHDVHVGLFLSMYAAQISNKLFEKEDK